MTATSRRTGTGATRRPLAAALRRLLHERAPGVVAVVLLASAASACAAPTATRGRTLVLRAGSERLAAAVTHVVDPARPARPLYTPQPADRLVAVTVRLANRGSTRLVLYPSADSQLSDAAGQTFHTVDFPTKGGALFPDGALRMAPHRTVTGVVTFAVPRSATGLTYQFSYADGFRAATGDWTLR